MKSRHILEEGTIGTPVNPAAQKHPAAAAQRYGAAVYPFPEVRLPQGEKGVDRPRISREEHELEKSLVHGLDGKPNRIPRDGSTPGRANGESCQAKDLRRREGNQYRSFDSRSAKIWPDAVAQ